MDNRSPPPSFSERVTFLKILSSISIRLGPRAGSDEPHRKKPDCRATSAAKGTSMAAGFGTSFMGPGWYSRKKKNRKMAPEANIVFTSLPAGFSNYPLWLVAPPVVTTNNKAITRQALLSHISLLQEQHCTCSAVTPMLLVFA